MHQLEISFFYPLTEQIPLDLDFKNCIKPGIYGPVDGLSSNYLISAGGNWSIVNTTPTLTIDVDTCPITIRSKVKPNFIKRLIYRSLGMKWTKI